MFADRGITHAFLVPAVLQFMLMVPGVDEADYSTLKVFVYGASPISEEVLARSVKMFKCKFWQAYGLTETTGTVVNLPPEDHDPDGPNKHRLRSCGVAGPGVELRIVDTDTLSDVLDGRGRRDLGQVGAGDEGLLEHARRDGEGDHRRWLVPQWRRWVLRRRRVPVHPRPREGHDRQSGARTCTPPRSRTC